MNRIIEAIDAEIQELDTRRTWLLVMRKMATEGPSPRMLDAVELVPAPAPPSLPAQAEGQVDGSDSSPSDEEPKSEPAKPKRQPRRRRPVARSSVPAERPSEIGPLGGQDRKPAAKRTGDAKAKSEARDRILVYVRENPGKVNREIAEALGLNEGSTSPILRGLCVHGGPLRVEKSDRIKAGKAYFPREGDLAPPDGSGCRTKVERKVFAAVRDFPAGQTTTAEVAANSGVEDPAPILAGLANRGVLERESTDRVGAYLWSVAAMAEAV